MSKTVAILGCMDSKGEEYVYIKRHTGVYPGNRYK